MDDNKDNSIEFEADFKRFLDDIKQLCDSTEGLARTAVRECEPLVNRMIQRMVRGEVSESELENMLDRMLDFCFNNDMLLLYKRLLRAAYIDFPDTVIYYINAYFEMFGSPENE